MTFFDKDKKYMKLALEKAKEAASRNEFPVGAVLTIDDKVIGTAFNRVNENNDWNSHAERLLIDKYGKKIKNTPINKKLQIYTTLEPCLMCLGTIILNKFDRLVYGCKDPFGGATNLKHNGLPEWYFYQSPEIKGNVLAKESYDLLVNHMKKNSQKYDSLLYYFLDMKKPK